MLHEKSLGSVRILSVDYPALKDTLLEAASEIKKTDRSVVQILLYGSFARGNYTPLSDVDILIMVDNTDIPFLCRKEAYSRYFFSIPFDVNILVYTADEFNRMLESGNLFLTSVLQNAVEL